MCQTMGRATTAQCLKALGEGIWLRVGAFVVPLEIAHLLQCFWWTCSDLIYRAPEKGLQILLSRTRQGQAEQVSESGNKFLATTYKPFLGALYYMNHVRKVGFGASPV